ncbi:hypothetical protein G4L39_06455 [Limisphaera ngatamarikiensis]|uniref:Uncharacterized protein n=1 Tax=Limisphaera ngatamarikiensis TaxID=1324935 RepID=A0A6M1RNM2_9BACT|nr:hypothetical protein [Limisphaera ngatamarikiensis]NGO39037.1 hypothetical protein [Limisphaera ngatamarikiensis]
MRIIANTTELDGMLRRVIGRLEQPEQALRAVGNLIYSLTLGAFAHDHPAVVDGAPAFYSAFPNVTSFVRSLLGL